jgi:hypothetical protein
LNNSIRGIKFSPDGALLIAHSSSTTSFIVVFNVAAGKILSTRMYSTEDYFIYNFNVKSILISSGSIPSAYVLSSKISAGPPSSCNRQLLFKFDPLTFRSTPEWIY